MKKLIAVILLVVATSVFAGEVHVRQVTADKYILSSSYSFLTTRTDEAIKYCYERALYDVADWVVLRGLHTTGTYNVTIVVDMLRGECGVAWSFRAVRLEGGERWRLR